jgi:hypothetical protein
MPSESPISSPVFASRAVSVGAARCRQWVENSRSQVIVVGDYCLCRPLPYHLAMAPMGRGSSTSARAWKKAEPCRVSSANGRVRCARGLYDPANKDADHANRVALDASRCPVLMPAARRRSDVRPGRRDRARAPAGDDRRHVHVRHCRWRPRPSRAGRDAGQVCLERATCNLSAGNRAGPSPGMSQKEGAAVPPNGRTD